MIPQVAIESLKKQICDHFHAKNWEEVIDDDCLYLEFSTYLQNKSNFWELELPADDFKCGDFWVVPFCYLAQGGYPIATYNLELIKHVSYQQAEFNVYARILPKDFGYLVYLGQGSEVEPPTIFKM